MRAREFAAKLSMRVLSRMWQMLLKGITEVQAATRPAAAAEMVLVRIAYVADLPTPDEAIRMLEQNGGASPVVSAQRRASRSGAGFAPCPRCRPSPARACVAAASAELRRARRWRRRPPSRNPRRRCASRAFPQLVALAGEKRDLLTKAALEADVRLVRIEDGRLELALERQRARGPDQRSLAQAGTMDRPALDRDRLQRGRPADAALAERARAGPSASAPPRPIRGCRRCWRAFPAPRSSRSAGLPPSRRNPMYRRRPCRDRRQRRSI